MTSHVNLDQSRVNHEKIAHHSKAEMIEVLVHSKKDLKELTDLVAVPVALSAVIVQIDQITHSQDNCDAKTKKNA
jgi:hypothetical protein